jgi:hypothetical protein
MVHPLIEHSVALIFKIKTQVPFNPPRALIRSNRVCGLSKQVIVTQKQDSGGLTFLLLTLNGHHQPD